MKEEEQFFSKENMQKFLNGEPYLETKDTGEVDFCLGTTPEDAIDIFQKYLKQKGRKA